MIRFHLQQFSEQLATPHHPITPSPHSILWFTQLKIAVSLIAGIASLVTFTACTPTQPGQPTADAPSPATEVAPVAASPAANAEKPSEMAANKNSAAETGDPKAGFAGMKQVVANTTAAATAGNFAKAKEEFDQFEGYWSKVEDGVKAKSASSYKDIEESMDNVEIALKSADKAKAIAALQSLGKNLAGYAAKL